jgi:hypothetical protein
LAEPRAIHELLAFLDQAYDRRAWHGPNLRGSLRRVSAEHAAWRSCPARHNIWEIAAALSERELSRAAEGGSFTNRALVSGAAAHDLYHAGQIQLLKRLAPP